MSNIEQRTITTISDVLGNNKVDIDSTTESLKMDSLDEVEIILALENEFDIEIPDSATEIIQTVRGLVDFIYSMAR